MDLLDSFLTSLSSRQTRRAYRTDLHRFFSTEASAGAAHVQSVEPADIRAFVRTMRDLGRSEGTQQRRLAALRSFFDWTIKEGIQNRNPARHPDIQPMTTEGDPSAARSLTKQEVRSVLEAAGSSTQRGLRDQVLILTIIYAALRRSEVAGLQVEDFRPLGRYWVLDLDGASAGGGYVRIPELVVNAIEKMKDTYGISSGPLWRSMSNRNRGESLSPDAIYSIVRRAGKTANVGQVSIDTLRRTGLRLAAEGGADVSQIRVHGRFGDAASAAQIQDAEAQSGKLGDSAAEYIDLDVSELPANP